MPPFPQRLHHQRKVSLLQIAHTTVNNFRASARCPRRKVSVLQQEGPVAAPGRLNRRSQTSSAATDNDNIQLALSISKLLNKVIATHNIPDLTNPGLLDITASTPKIW